MQQIRKNVSNSAKMRVVGHVLQSLEHSNANVPISIITLTWFSPGILWSTSSETATWLDSDGVDTVGTAK